MYSREGREDKLRSNSVRISDALGKEVGKGSNIVLIVVVGGIARGRDGESGRGLKRVRNKQGRREGKGKGLTV